MKLQVYFQEGENWPTGKDVGVFSGGTDVYVEMVNDILKTVRRVVRYSRKYTGEFREIKLEDTLLFVDSLECSMAGLNFIL